MTTTLMCRKPTAWDEFQAERYVKEFGASEEQGAPFASGAFEKPESERVRDSLESLACNKPPPDFWRAQGFNFDPPDPVQPFNVDTLASRDAQLRDEIASLVRSGWSITQHNDPYFPDRSIAVRVSDKQINIGPNFGSIDEGTQIYLFAHEINHALELQSGLLPEEPYRTMDEETFVNHQLTLEARADFHALEAGRRFGVRVGSDGDYARFCDRLKRMEPIFDRYLQNGDREAAMAALVGMQRELNESDHRAEYRFFTKNSTH